MAREWEHTRTHGDPSRVYNDRQLFIPPLTSAAPHMSRESSEHQFYKKGCGHYGKYMLTVSCS